MKQFEQLGSCVFIKCLSELVDCWWDLKSLIKNTFLPLKPMYLGHFTYLVKSLLVEHQHLWIGRF